MNLPAQIWTVGQADGPAQREALIRFWLAAPADLLQPLWQGQPGQTTQQLVRSLTPQTVFTPDQVALREALNGRISSLGLQHPLAAQLLLALVLLSPPGLFKVADPQHQLPPWLLPAYRELYEQAAVAPTPAITTAPPLPTPDFGEFPASLELLVGNRIHLNRMLGLANLYYIDPEDREICAELLELRRSLADRIRKAPEVDLERIWATDLGERYWAVVRSGIQQEPLQAADAALRDAAVQALNPAVGPGLGAPGATNALLVAMLYLAPGSWRVSGAAERLPAWLLSHYQQVFEQDQKLTV